MDYKRIYKQLIEKRKQYPAELENSYIEKHHIIPRSINSTLENNKANIVSLTAREHFIAHLLLVKIFEKKNEVSYRKMLHAFNLMCQMNSKRNEYNSINFNSHLYENLRIKASKMLGEFVKNYWAIAENKEKIMGENNGMKNKKWITNAITHKVKAIFKDDPVPERLGSWKETTFNGRTNRKDSYGW